MKDKTERLFEQVSAGFSNRCVELAREGRSGDAETLHAMHRKFVAMIVEWAGDNARRRMMMVAPKPWPIARRYDEWPAPPQKVVDRG